MLSPVGVPSVRGERWPPWTWEDCRWWGEGWRRGETRRLSGDSLTTTDDEQLQSQTRMMLRRVLFQLFVILYLWFMYIKYTAELLYIYIELLESYWRSARFSVQHASERVVYIVTGSSTYYNVHLESECEICKYTQHCDSALRRTLSYILYTTTLSR